MTAVRLAAILLLLVSAPVSAQSVEDVNGRLDTLYGGHDTFEAAFGALQDAVAVGDAETVASLVWYPLKVRIDGESYVIKDEPAFAERYEDMFTLELSGLVTSQAYADLFVNDQGVMFGDGELWLANSCLDRRCRYSVWLISAINDTSE